MQPPFAMSTADIQQAKSMRKSARLLTHGDLLNTCSWKQCKSAWTFHLTMLYLVPVPVVVRDYLYKFQRTSSFWVFQFLKVDIIQRCSYSDEMLIYHGCYLWQQYWPMVKLKGTQLFSHWQWHYSQSQFGWRCQFRIKAMPIAFVWLWWSQTWLAVRCSYN